MSRRSEMEAKLRKGPAMLGQAKFHERLKKHVLDFASEIDDLRTQLAACAAGEWRTDVENAPRGEYWAHVSNPGQTERRFSVVVLKEYWQLPHSGLPVMVHAFAVPNPPQEFDIPEWHDNDSGGYVQ